MKGSFRLAAAVITLLFLSGSALAQRDQLFVGARPMALGEAFVAAANDGNSSYWNPAGMAFVRRIELTALYDQLYGFGINNGFIGLLYPLSKNQAVGGNWFYFGTDDPQLRFGQNLFTLSYGVALNKHMALGANVKYARLTSADLNEAGQQSTSIEGDGFGADLGALLSHTFEDRKFPHRVQLGVMAHDFANTKLHYGDSDEGDPFLRRNVRAGLALAPFDEIDGGWLKLNDPLLVFDLDDRWHLGAELWLDRVLALRGGLQNDLDPLEGAIVSFGAGIRWKFMQFDYAYAIPPTLGETHRFSFSLCSEENPWLVTIEDASMQSVFASLYQTYNSDSAGIGMAFIRNSFDEPITASVSLNVKDYMLAPTERIVELEPDQITPVRLNAVFTEKILNIAGRGKSLKAEIAVRYRYRDMTPEDHRKVDFFVHGTGAIAWDDPARAAAFVTQLDPCVDSFTQRVLDSYPVANDLWIGRNSQAVQKAVLMFAALRALRLRYVADPNRDLRTIDTIYYPRDLLNGRRTAGDCDDLTVLYASLLESCGVQTAFLSTPDHFFLMFNTGFHANRPVPYDENLFVTWGNSLWMPIETTVCAQNGSFGDAWEQGAANYRHYMRELETLLVTNCQLQYPPPPFTELACAPPKTPTELGYMTSDTLASVVDLDLQAKEHIEKLYALTAQFPESLAVRNDLGLAWAMLGDEGRAEQEFLQILAADSTQVNALNNLGNVMFLSARLDTADVLYARALQLDPYATGLYLNRAVLAQMRIDDARLRKNFDLADSLQALSDLMLTEAGRRLEADPAAAFALLGLRDETTNKAGVTDEMREKIGRVKKMVEAAFRQYSKQKFVKGSALEKAGIGKGGRENDEAILWWGK